MISKNITTGIACSFLRLSPIGKDSLLLPHIVSSVLVSVRMWLDVLSYQLRIFALVVLYTTNKLIGLRLILSF